MSPENAPPEGWHFLTSILPTQLADLPPHVPLLVQRPTVGRRAKHVRHVNLYGSSGAFALLDALTQGPADLPVAGWFYVLAAVYPGVPFDRVVTMFRLHPAAVLDPVRRAAEP